MKIILVSEDYAQIDGKNVHLTPTEIKVLLELYIRRVVGKDTSYQELIDAIFGYSTIDNLRF